MFDNGIVNYKTNFQLKCMNLIYALRRLKCDLKNKLCKQKFTPEMVIILKVTKMYNAIYIIIKFMAETYSMSAHKIKYIWLLS